MKRIIALSMLLGLGAFGLACNGGNTNTANNATNRANAANTVANMANSVANMANKAADNKATNSNTNK